MKEEKLRALLLKLRKGSGWGLKVKALLELVEVLGLKASIEDLYYPDPMSMKAALKGAPNLTTFTHADAELVRARWQACKDAERTSVDPDSLHASDLGQELCTNVGALHDGPTGQLHFEYSGWTIKAGTRLVLDGHRFDTDQPLRAEGHQTPFLETSVESVRGLSGQGPLPTWLKTTAFYAKVNAYLGTEDHDQERARKAKDREARERVGTGTCAVCLARYKLLPRARLGDSSLPGLVAHGYRRPGDGELVGKCFGCEYPPWETSVVGAEAWLREELVPREEAMKMVLADLRACWVNEIAMIDVDEGRYRFVEGFRTATKWVRERDMASRADWERLLADQAEGAEYQLQQHQTLIAGARERLATWQRR